METERSDTYYAIQFRLDGEARFFIWYSMDTDERDPDRVVLDPQGDLLVFENLDALHAHARIEGFQVEPIVDRMALDLDSIQTWCTQPTADNVDCHKFLETWNMMDDVLLSLGKAKLLHDGQTACDDGVYEKLFWGTNPRALMPAGAEDFKPSWTEEQIDVIEVALRRGLRIFRSILRA